MSYTIANHGWDLIAATTQRKLNSQLVKIPSVTVQKKTQFQFSGMTFPVDIDVVIGAPQLQIKKGSGHFVDIRFGVTGSITLGTNTIAIPAGEFLTTTTDLAQIEAELQPHPDEKKTTYDLIINLENRDAIVDMVLDIDPADLAFLVKILEKVIKQDIGNGKKYTVATFDLSNQDVTDFKALIPHVADFSFVQDDTNIERSNLLVLMNSVSTKKGELFFNAPLLPPDQDFMVMASNRLFLTSYIQPSLIDTLKKIAKKPDDVAGQIETVQIDSVNDYWQVQNKSDIPLDKDHDPWVSTVNANFDTAEKALQFYLDAKADITFLDIRVDVWDKSWQQLWIDDQGSIRMKQIKEESGKSQEMDWWKWLLSALVGIVALLIVIIIYAIVQSQTPGIGGSFASLGSVVVKWPNQKEARLKEIITPGHIALFLDVSFD